MVERLIPPQVPRDHDRPLKNLCVSDYQHERVANFLITKRIYHISVPPDDSLMHKPEFIKGLKDMTINDTEMLTLQCSVKGDPDPQITWSKNGKKISSSEIIDLKYKSGVATLKINEVFPEDEGEYTCTATNSVGSTESKCRLQVKRKS
jgi:Immunoglobulin I-set domain